MLNSYRRLQETRRDNWKGLDAQTWAGKQTVEEQHQAALSAAEGGEAVHAHPSSPSQKAVIASVRSYQAKHSEYFAGEYILLN